MAINTHKNIWDAANRWLSRYSDISKPICWVCKQLINIGNMFHTSHRQNKGVVINIRYIDKINGEDIVILFIEADREIIEQRHVLLFLVYI